MKINKTIRISFALLILAVLFYLVDLNQLWQALSQITIELLIFLFLITVLLVYISAVKWQFFLEAIGSRVPALHLSRLYLIGYFVNLFVPSYIGGDAVRSWYAGKKVGQHEAATATILERYTGFVAMVTLGLIFVWFVDNVTWQIRLAVVGVALGLAVLTILALSPKLIDQFERIKKLRSVLVHIRKVQAGLHLARKNKSLLLKAMTLSYMFHTVTVVNTFAAANAVGWLNPPIGDLFVVLPLILLIGSIPITPSGLGVQEGAFVFFLVGLGATPAQALGVGVVLRAKAYVTALVGGLFWLQLRRGELQKNTELSCV